MPGPLKSRTKYGKNLLIVDDDPAILLTARLVLKPFFSEVQTESQPHELSPLLSRQAFDLVLLDMNFTTGFTSGKEGLRWLKKIRKLAPRTPVMLMTAYGDIELAVRAMKEGARDFVVKPWDNEELIAKVRQILKPPPSPKKSSSAPVFGTIQNENKAIIGKSAAIKAIFDQIGKVAQTEANILILGENGTGKELVAWAIHRQSARKNGPFVQVDLGAITESLFESEMFGHVKGAFTDARSNRTGRIASAHGGTLFLDEIGNLSLAMQAKMLTVLQNRQVVPVGSNRPLPLDIRLVCATNQSLVEKVQQQLFRQDLLYRINTVEISLPPLRDRMGDIPLLCQHFLQRYSQRYGKPPLDISTQKMADLEAYHWPGNVRELQHAIERAVIMESTESLLPVSPESPPAKKEPQEAKWIGQALQRNQGNLSQTALELGWTRKTLYKKMEKYGLKRPK